jgi:serine O-acetyltransferase
MLPTSSESRRIMDHRTFIRLIQSDLYRYAGSSDRGSFVRTVVDSPGFRFSFWLRVVAWLRSEPSALRALLPLAGLVKRHLSYKYGISIPASTEIGAGFYIGHIGGIVVNEAAVIGRNCNISQGVTVGQVNRGARRGSPRIGDNVYLGPGAKVIGSVTVGSNVAVGANAVVTKDVPDNAVVGGVPAVVLSHEGSVGYVNRTEYRPDDVRRPDARE